MNNLELLNLLEKNLKDWRKAKDEKQPIMSNFHFYCMCYMPIVSKLEQANLTEEEKARFEQCQKDYEEIKEMSYVDLDDIYGKED